MNQSRTRTTITFIFSIIFCLVIFAAIAETLPEEYAFIISKGYDTFTLSYTGDNNEYEVISENINIAQIGYVMISANSKSIIVAGRPVNPGQTTFLVRDKNTKKEYFRIPVIVPGEDEIAPTSSKMTGSSTSFLDNEIVKELISICPAISTATKETKDTYNSEDLYKKDFPIQDGKIHTWKIGIQKGVFSFCDEKQVTILLTIPTGRPSEIAPTLEWEIKLLEALPQIKEASIKEGVDLIANKWAEDSDYAYLANKNGIIDLLDEEKYKTLLKQEQANLELLETVNVFEGLGELDKNGNGTIDFDELFN